MADKWRGEGKGRKKERKKKWRGEPPKRAELSRDGSRVWLDSRQKVKGLVYRTPAGQKLVYVVSFS